MHTNAYLIKNISCTFEEKLFTWIKSKDEVDKFIPESLIPPPHLLS